MKVKKFQAGGPAPEDMGGAGAPAPAQEPQAGGAEEQLAQMAMQIIQQLGPEAAAVLAQMIMQVLQQGAGGGAPQGEPVYAKKGGKLTLVARR